MNNNKIFVLLIFYFLFTSITSISYSDFKNSNYFNKKYKYSISLPHDWVMGEAPSKNSAYFFDPFEHRRDDFKENLIISVEELYKITDLEDLYLKSLLYMRKHYKGFRIIKEKTTTINRLKGKMIIYQYSSVANIKYQIMQMFFVRGKKSYTLTFTALAKTFTQYKYPMAECFFSFKLN